MAIQQTLLSRQRSVPVAFVSGASNQNNANSSWEAGVPSGMQQGDLLLVALVVATTSISLRNINIGSGFSILSNDLVYNSDGLGTYRRIGYKFMGATPDTSLLIGSNAGSEVTYVSYSAYRNVSHLTPIDATPIVTTSNSTAVISTPNITPSVSGAMAIYVGANSSIYGAGSILPMTSGGSYTQVTSQQLDFDFPNVAGLIVQMAAFTGATIGASTFYDSEYLGGTVQSGINTTFALRPA